jgi:hypothetical protein
MSCLDPGQRLLLGVQQRSYAGLLDVVEGGFASVRHRLDELSKPDRAVSGPPPLAAAFGGAEVVPQSVVPLGADDEARLVQALGDASEALLNWPTKIRGRWIERPELQVILSCREFDYQHDTRLTTMGAADIHLGPLDWPQVEQILTEARLEPAAWHPEFREVLRLPQRLELFLRHLAEPGAPPPYAGYRDMMEAVLRKRVIGAPSGHAVAEALHEVARAMVVDEELWVPAARFDARANEIDLLEAAGLLVREAGHRRIGFRHQTLFDFVRARAFVAEHASVADSALAS